MKFLRKLWFRYHDYERLSATNENLRRSLRDICGKYDACKKMCIYYKGLSKLPENPEKPFENS